MSDDAQLLVQLEARINQFEKAFQKASQVSNDNWTKIEARGRTAASRMQSDMGKAASGIAGSFASIGGSVAGSLGIGGALGLSGFLALAVRVNGELAKLPGLAKLAGVSIERIQELKFAANVGGVEDETFKESLQSSMALLDEAQRQVNSLSRLFRANNMELKQSNGEMLTFDTLLERAAQLMAGARTQQARVKIAEMLGLSRDWIRVLEGGAEAFRKSAAEANSAGAVIDREVVQRAKDFDRQWREATVRFKAGMTEALSDLSDAFGEFWKGVVDSVPGASWIQDVVRRWAGGLQGMELPELQYALKKSMEQGLTGEVDRIQAEIDRRLGKKPLRIRVTAEPPPNETIIPKEHERNPFEREVYSTKKRIAAIEAETVTIGLNSEARERAKTVAELEEAAKKANTQAGYQNATVTEEQRRKINQLADAMEAAARKQREAETRWKSFNEALSFTGNLAVDFIDKLGDRTAKFSDLVLTAVNSLKKAAIQAALLGEGPLAGLFGLKSASGGVGGLLGLLFGGFRAEGGPVASGKSYIVGERGPEIFAPKGAGSIIPNKQAFGTANAVNTTITINVQGGSQGPQADAQLAEKIGKHVHDAVRTVIGKELRAQMRPGGTLNRR